MKLGNKIRLIRKRKGITLKEISKNTNFSISFISQLERDLVSPSIDSLKMICDALEVPLAALFDDDKFEQITSENVVRKNHRKTLAFSGSKAEMFLLSPDLNRKLELILIIAQPNAKSGEEYHTHGGEECGMVLKGKMEIILEDKSYILEEGDSFYFNSTTRHKWCNPWNEESISIWAITPPSF